MEKDIKIQAGRMRLAAGNAVEVMTQMVNPGGEVVDVKWVELKAFLKAIVQFDKRLNGVNIDHVLASVGQDFYVQVKFGKLVFTNVEIINCIEFYSKRELGETFGRPALESADQEAERQRLEKEEMKVLLGRREKGGL